MCRVPDIKRKLIVPVTEPLVSDLRFILRHKGERKCPADSCRSQNCKKSLRSNYPQNFDEMKKLSCVEGTRLAEISGPHCPI